MSPLRGGDRAPGELWLKAPRPRSPARPNRRREHVYPASPRRGAPKDGKIHGKSLTLFSHPFTSEFERRFAPTSVRLEPESCPISIGTGVRFHRNPNMGSRAARFHLTADLH